MSNAVVHSQRCSHELGDPPGGCPGTAAGDEGLLGIASLKLGRSFVGIELSPEYVFLLAWFAALYLYQCEEDQLN